MIAIVMVLAIAASPQSPRQDGEVTRPLRLDPNCGVALSLPRGWSIARTRGWERVWKSACHLVLRPPEGGPAIELRVRTGTLDSAADDLGFEKRGERWFIVGEGSQPASAAVTAEGVTLVGSVSTRLYERGVYSGIGDETRGILAGPRNRVVELKGFDSDETVLVVLRHLRFMAPLRRSSLPP